MKKLFFLLLVIALPFVKANAQTVPTADEVLKTASAKAAKEKKNVFVLFHASWCGWCHKMDTVFAKPGVKELIGKSYVVEHLTVKESPQNKHLENPGAEALMAKYNGDKSGIPFWLVFDPTGKLIADSFMRPAGADLNSAGDNIGCPATDEEVAAFEAVLKKSTKLDEKQIAQISAAFRAASPKRS
ncbi:thioredoxin-like protein [Chitinophaga skermanii]|uniref:Thioredoxin-like protein n=1 Tax=Chitinophaga skermanii TaxID=331697 RepID=A0A327QG00_9BACT|nr:thioredoxin family protein [Chitinophaga skermanii]RAJ02562.1 thioredoxin-like protein [Chitinophaga skermanii]